MASATLPPVGLIGLGTMGGAIAIRLLEQGIDLTVYDIDAASIARLRAATSKPVKVAGSLEDLGRRSTIVLCSLAHPDILLDAITGPAGLHKGLAEGSIVVDTSTSGPDVARRCGEFLAGIGCQMADATIGRGPAAALRGELVLMLGGSNATLDRIEPVIRLLAAKIVRCGGLGSAQVIKLANNLVACANLAVIAEAYRFVREQGADPRLLLDVMQGTYADSFQLQKSVAGKAVNGDFAIVFRLDLAAKDVRLMCDAAAAQGLEPGIGAATLAWYEAAVAAGHGKIDWSAVMLVADPSLASSTTR